MDGGGVPMGDFVGYAAPATFEELLWSNLASALSLAVLLSTVWAAGFAEYGEVLAVPADAEFLASLT